MAFVDLMKVGDLPADSMKQVSVNQENGQTHDVLLVHSSDDKWFATSAKCTHHGAPLEKGTLDGDKVICPWHGACFSCASGDIEDAPALDPLHSFEVRVQGDTVQVKTPDGGWPASHKRTAHVAPSASPDGPGAGKRIVVIGGGAAGMTAVQTLREEGWCGDVVLVTAEQHLPYDRVKLSKGVGVNVADIELRPASWFVDAAIEVRTGARVSSVDVGSRTVVLQGGGTLQYDGLLLATGSQARRLPVEGGDLPGIHTLRSPEDASKLSEAVGSDGSKDVVIVGSSFIGVEYAASLAASGAAQSITVLGSTPFKRVLGEEVGAFVQSKLESKGIKFISGHASKFEAGASGAVGSVILKNGEEGGSLPAHVVVLGVGAAPSVPSMSGHESIDNTLHKDGSVFTDASFKVCPGPAAPPVPGLWAAGDIARFARPDEPDPNKHVRIEHWSVAQQQGRLAARDMVATLSASGGAAAAAGSGATSSLGVPFFWTALAGVGNIRYTGLASDGFDRVVFEGGVAPTSESSRFVACYEREGRVVAVATYGADPACTNAQAMLNQHSIVSSTNLLTSFMGNTS